MQSIVFGGGVTVLVLATISVKGGMELVGSDDRSGYKAFLIGLGLVFVGASMFFKALTWG